MSYQQLHAGKVKLSGLGGIIHHLLDRSKVKTNPDIDLTRSQLNHAIEDLSPQQLVSRVHQRIKQLRLKRKPRTDVVGLEDIIVGASADFMLKLGVERREQYFEDALHFFQRRYGEENVMYCQCHLDESNPHVHIGVVPVTADGRLSAKEVFSPQTLEHLQTDFYQAVAQHYELERGEHQARRYLELNQFKAAQTNRELQQHIDTLDTLSLTLGNLERVGQAARFASSGVFIRSINRELIQLPTEDFDSLRKMAEEGAKAAAVVNLLQAQNRQLQHKNRLAQSANESVYHELKKLREDTAPYAAVPRQWRTHVNDAIEELQHIFTAFCHDVNRATVKAVIATHGDFERTKVLLRDLFVKSGVKDENKHIAEVVHAANLQKKRNLKPTVVPSSWKPPKPAETDYQRSYETTIVQLRLSEVPDIDWNAIDWELLSEIDKDCLQHRQLVREL